MGDVLIHRCTLRLVRRGGWSWGPDPGRLVREAMRRLPDLVAEKLAGLAPDAKDREFLAPLRVRLRVRLGHFASALEADSAGRAIDQVTVDHLLGSQIEAALRAATGLGEEPALSGELEQPASHMPLASGIESLAPFRSGGALMRLLMLWRECGALERRLSLLSTPVLEPWLKHLRQFAEANGSEPHNESRAEEMEAFVRERAGRSAGQDHPGRLRRWIAIAVEAACNFSAPADGARLWRVLESTLPLAPGQPMAAARASSPPETIPGSPDASLSSPLSAPAVLPAAPSVSARQRPKSLEWETRIDSSLPFLLLNPLSRVGYFAALDGILEAAELSPDSNLFAAALAYKVLDPPERSWRRSTSSELSSAVFAGQIETFREDALVAFARRMDGLTAPLDVLLADAIIAAHAAEEPLTLHAAGTDETSNCLLVDTQGCLPIAWVPRAGEPKKALFKYLRAFGAPVVMVSRTTAATSLLRDLHEANISFLTDVPPARGETWDRIRFGTGPSGWTNAAGSAPPARLHHALNEMTVAFEEAERLTDELLARPAVVRAPSPLLDRSISLAAGTAVGTMAWMLWQRRGRTTPQQFLERYADFDARVHVDPVSVRVSLPLGRRYFELRDAGLLAPVRDVPWLSGRTVEFIGG